MFEIFLVRIDVRNETSFFLKFKDTYYRVISFPAKLSCLLDEKNYSKNPIELNNKNISRIFALSNQDNSMMIIFSQFNLETFHFSFRQRLPYCIYIYIYTYSRIYFEMFRNVKRFLISFAATPRSTKEKKEKTDEKNCTHATISDIYIYIYFFSILLESHPFVLPVNHPLLRPHTVFFSLKKISPFSWFRKKKYIYIEKKNKKSFE